MKNTLRAVAVLFLLTLPVWANEPVGDNKKKTTTVPEGGNWPTYTIVSGVALLGGLWLARKQRASETLADKN